MPRSLPLRPALAAAFVLLGAPAAVEAAEEPRWAATLYGGVFTDSTWIEALATPWNADYGDAGLVAAGLSTVYARRDLGGRAVFEAGGEALVGRWVGDQRNWELSLAPALARVRAPSGVAALSFSLGLSFASQVPELERDGNRGSSATLVYWALEAEAGPLPGSNWSLAGRLHHRSTGYGLFGDSGGSNSFLLGLRRRF